MAKIKGLNLSQNNVSQTINLEEEFGIDLSSNRALKQRIGQAMIDKIVERSESGKGNNGKNLKSPYSTSYANSKKFELYGKSRGDVNMTLKGDMLNSLDIEDSGNDLTVKVDENQAPKSYNHQVGDTVPRRPWFGVNKKELNEIKREFKDELRQIKEGKEEVKERQEQQKVDLATIRALAQQEPSVEARFASLFGGLFNGESEV